MKLSLERALEYIGLDAHLKATPKNLGLQKKELDDTKRKRTGQQRVLKVVEA